MIRRLLTILICAAGAVSAMAQTASGWYKYPVFSGNYDNLVCASDRVYYRAGSSLFSYSEQDGENFAYSTNNVLSDVIIHDIYYNPEKKFLAVAYDNGNLDLVYDNGNVINLPDIKDANVYASKGINTVTFDGDEMYVATDFGYVVYDTKRAEVKSSVIFNEKITGVVKVGNDVIVHHSGDYKLAPANGNKNRLENYTTILNDGWLPTQIYALDNGFVYRSKGKVLVYVEKVNGTYQLRIYEAGCNPLQRRADGTVFTTNNTQSIVVGRDGQKTKTDLPGNLQNKIISSNDGNTYWGGTTSGLVKYNAEGDELSGGILPDGCLTFDIVNLMNWNKSRDRLYLSRTVSSKNRPGSINSSAEPQVANRIENGEPTDITVLDCDLVNLYNGQNYQNANGNKRLYGGNYWHVENPYDKDMYFVSSDWNGVLAIKDQKMVTSFTQYNSKYNQHGTRAEGVFVDPENNLWIGCVTTGQMPFVQVLPAQYLRPENITNVGADKWIQSPVLGNYCEKDFKMVFSTKCGMAFTINGNWGLPLVCYDTKGTYADPSDDEALFRGSLTDQDGKTFTATRAYCMTEDKQGHIWIGTAGGPIVITEPEKALSSDFTIRRPKVSRNDGTNFADYLLESDAINWIAVDPANNKWLATQSSGLYLVNPDGSKILSHYDTSNSPLTSNAIYCVEQSSDDNSVYVGTETGVYRFYSSVTPAAEDYSEIYAYPNPVRPDYTGWVTIKGLTEGSLVKIVDAGGNLVAQIQANGGSAQWDVCNMHGARVRSGVYYVFASSGPNDDRGKGAVTKVVVIN